MSIMRKGWAVALAVAATSGCATKGYVREQVQAMADTSRTAWVAGDSQVRTELSNQIAGVQSDVDSVKSDVASLRQDLNGLRDEFGAKIIAMENGLQFVFPVRFAFDDATVRTEDQASLDRFAQVVTKHYTGSLVTVEGFADPAGSAEYNRRLSEDRAESVIAYLNQTGISGVTLRSAGYGESRPVVPGAARDMPGAESNRRVVFVVESAGPAGPSVTR